MSVPDIKPPSSVRRITPQSTLPPIEDLLRELTVEEVRLIQRRLSEQAECVYDEAFRNPSLERELMKPIMPAQPARPKRGRPRNDDSGLDLFGSGGVTMNAEQERHIFQRLNYARYRVMRLIRDYKGQTLTIDAIREILHWEGLACETRAQIVRSNMPLVLAMAKRTKITNVDSADMISEGNLALLRSVDKFDCNRGFKFSTYACRAILKGFSRVASRISRYRLYFPTEYDPSLEKSDFTEQRRHGLERECVTELKNIMSNNLANLNDVERKVIEARFALDDTAAAPGESVHAKTLEEVGELIGVTKERVRQIQNKALTKLKVILEDGVLSPS